MKLFRSDKGTNFGINAINVEDKKVQTYLKDNRATWYKMTLMHRIWEEFGNEPLEGPTTS